MTQQPEALRLADALFSDAVSPIDLKAAAELRRLHDAYEVSGLALNQALKSIEELSAENKRLKQAIAGGINAQLAAALNAMLTHMGMDEDEWNKPTFDQARAAIAAAKGEA